VIAAARGNAGDVGIDLQVRELGRLAGVPFERVVAGADCVLAAGVPGSTTSMGTAVWIGCPAPTTDPVGSLASLRGPFAFAAAHPGGLLLGRGRLGGHPLYYGRTASGAVLACSRLEPLVRLLGRQRAIDVSAVTGLLLGTPSADTPYQGIRRLGTGELRLISPTDDQRIPLSRAPRPAVANAEVEEVAEELLRLVGAAVTRAVGSDRKVVVCVGGLDSSGLLAVLLAMSRGASPREVTALTLHFAGVDDDRPYVRDLCRALEIEPVRVPPATWARHMLDPVALDGWPNTRAQAYWLIGVGEWARERGIATVVNGEGGDSLFDGDVTVFSTGLMTRDGLRGICAAYGLKGLPHLGSPRRRVEMLVVRPALRRLLPRLHRSRRRKRIRRQLADSHRWLRPELRRLLEDQLCAEAGETARAWDWMVLDNREFLDRCALHSGCRFAQPYLDEDLVDFIEALPARLLFHGGYRRGLYRFAFRRLLPDSVRLREWKSGFGPALGESFVAAGGARLIAPYRQLPRLAALGLVEPREFHAVAERLVGDPAEAKQWMGPWAAIALEAFLADAGRAGPGTVAH
jgi:asparagine synthetase B (glutamine-hydrolysing)